MSCLVRYTEKSDISQAYLMAFNNGVRKEEEEVSIKSLLKFFFRILTKKSFIIIQAFFYPVERTFTPLE